MHRIVLCISWLFCEILIYKNESVSVCVCMFTMHGHMRAPILTKLGTVKFWAQGQVFNASGIPQVHVLAHDGRK